MNVFDDLTFMVQFASHGKAFLSTKKAVPADGLLFALTVELPFKQPSRPLFWRARRLFCA